MVGQVHLERRDGHPPLRHRMEIGALAGFARITGRPDPVDRLAAGIGLGDDRRTGMPAPQPGGGPGQLVGIGPVRDVHVEQPGRDRACLRQQGQDGFHHPPRRAGGGVQVGPALLGLAEGDGRDAEQIAFHGGRDGAGIQGVIAHVGPLVDAGEHQIRPFRQQPGERDVHAVRGVPLT
jgi:hypothetical protein